MKTIILHTCGRFSRPLDAIGGYALNLISGLHELGYDAEMLEFCEDHLKAQSALRQKCQRLFQQGMFPIIHIQLTHPWCKNPFDAEFIARSKFPIVVTCQELRRMTELQGVPGVSVPDDGQEIQRYIIAILRAAKHVIFIDRNELALATELEQKFYLGCAHVIASKSTVIEVVPGGAGVCVPLTHDTQDVIHFGMFRYAKGLDRIGEFARLFRDDSTRNPSSRMHIIGAVGCGQEMFLYEILHATHALAIRELQNMTIEGIKDLLEKQFKDHPVQYHINLANAEISAIMASSQYAVFLFPEGATRYGSSIPAAVAHGLVPIVTDGRDIPEEFTRHDKTFSPMELNFAYLDGAAVVLENADGVAAQAYTAYKFLINNPDVSQRISASADSYRSAREPRNVANLHMEIYSSLSSVAPLLYSQQGGMHPLEFFTKRDTCAPVTDTQEPQGSSVFQRMHDGL